MTKDRDFLHLLFEQGPPPQVIWLRVGNSSNQALQAVLLRTLKEAVASLREGEPWVEIRSPV
jgi:predicted nuclease of predicted toxin-antitoxin system